MNTTKKNPKKPWPTKKAMEQVYAINLWGGELGDFYSGEGSHKLEIISPYVKVVTSFLNSFKNPLSVCDLGCGDFNIGKQLLPHTKQYTAIDIVPNLIARNSEKFKHPQLEFHCLDIAKEKLPNADCAIIRQVLQHISNAEITAILEKLTAYTYVILTEHLPNKEFTPNVDIISGQGIRLKKQSGINILKTPFNFKCVEEKILLKTELQNNKGVLVTTLFSI